MQGGGNIDWGRTEVRMMDRDLEKVIDVDDEPGNDVCNICFDGFEHESIQIKEAVQIKECAHKFHLTCIQRWLAEKSTCPVCRKSLFTIRGYQPKHPNSLFRVEEDATPLSGFPECSTLVLSFHLETGYQSTDMPLPGETFNGLNLTSFLPNNPEGQEIVRLLNIAWERGLLFRVGYNPQTNRMDQVVPNGFELKLRRDGGILFHGFPDPSYMNRLKADLKDVGVL
jgi:deltex-like protein